MTRPTPRLALATDHRDVVDTLVDAFYDDPMFAWLYPDREQRTTALTPFMTAMETAYRQVGHTYLVDGRAAALWSPPDVQTDYDEIATVMAEHAEDDRMAVVGEAFATTFDFHPAEPHFYLSMIGTRAGAQSQGHGGALLRRVLDICDDEGLVAHLESSSIRNVPLYERHGFVVTGEVVVADDVILRPMTRPAS